MNARLAIACLFLAPILVARGASAEDATILRNVPYFYQRERLD